MTAGKTGVVFLARHADGPPAFRRFADSYRAHPAGADHELIVIYKGFTQTGDLRLAREIFDGLPHLGIELEDVGFDIGAYLETSRRVAHEYLLFLNTHSAIAAPDWLAGLSRYVAQDGVGLAAAMGSYESIRDTVALLSRVIWESVGVGACYDRRQAYYFDFVLRQHHPEWYGPDGLLIPVAVRNRGLLRSAIMGGTRMLRYRWFMRNGTALIWPGAPRFDIRQFPAFPNPHIRSNGFMMRRERLLSLETASTPTKLDASLFESGENSLTARIRRSGLAAIVVGRDGRGYDVPDWSQSNTFRLGAQENLLITDNHTRAHHEMSAGARAAHVRMTWGDYLGPAPEDFPDLGFHFRRQPLQ